MIQSTTESARNTFSNGEYDVIFQWSKQIGWKKAGGRELDRRPDIMIRKNGIPVRRRSDGVKRAEALQPNFLRKLLPTSIMMIVAIPVNCE